MDDRFDERLRRRLGALDAAVPEARDIELARLRGRRTLARAGRGGGLLPLGLVTAAAAVVVGVALVGSSLGLGWGGAPLSSGSAAPPSVAPPSTGPSISSGMVITDAEAIQLASTSNPVIVTATITNRTGQTDKLVGAASPVATTGGLYGTCGCSLAPSSSSDTSGMAGLLPMPWWLINPGETIVLRAGDGSIVLSGLARPLTVGQTIEVTFEFASAAPVTVEVPVVASGD